MTCCVLMTTMYILVVSQAVLKFNGISMWCHIFRWLLQFKDYLLRPNPTAEEILRARAIEQQKNALELNNAGLAEANARAAVVAAATTLL